MKERLREKAKKIGILLCLFVTFFTADTSVFAADTAAQEQESSFFQEQEGNKSFIDYIGDGLIAIFLTGIKLFVVLFASAIRGVAGLLASVGGINANAGIGDAITISPEDVIFNKYNITDINFFDVNGLDGVMKSIRGNIAIWYYGLRNLAVAILLVVLIYVGIRMVVSATGEDKAKYKQMLINWFVSFVLVFVLHYGMLLIINVNEALVGIFDQTRQSINSELNTNDILNNLLWKSVGNFGAEGLGAAIAYVMLVGLSFIFLIMYIKRMITIAFLLLISPIITITYSIDKMGDGKSQALNHWFKEFFYNVWIQPFHCLLYLVFVVGAINVINAGTIAGAILGCIFIVFILRAEKIIKDIFGFQAKSMNDAMGMTGILLAGKFLNDAKKKSSGGGGGGGEGSPDKASEDLNKNAKKDPTIKPEQDGGSSDGDSGGGSGSGSGSGRQRGKAGQVAGVLLNHATGGRSLAGAAKHRLAKNARTASKAVLASMALVTGDASNVMTGWMAGGTAANMVEDAHNTRKARNNEKTLAGVYQHHRNETGRTDDEMYDFTEEILKSDPSKIASKYSGEDISYANYVYAQRDIYKNSGYAEDKVNGKVLDTIQKIQQGKIQPRIMKDMKENVR